MVAFAASVHLIALCTFGPCPPIRQNMPASRPSRLLHLWGTNAIGMGPVAPLIIGPLEGGGEGSKQGPPPLEGPSLLLGSCVLFRICSQWRAGGCIFGASSGSVVLESGRPWLGIERPILAPFQMARITSLDLSRRIAPTAGNKQRRWRLSFMFISVHYAYWTRVPQLVEICSHLAHFTLSICGTPIQLVGARLPCYVCFAFVRCEPNVVGPPGPTRLRWHRVRQK